MNFEGWRDSAPSVLPAISPTRGEIRCHAGFRQSPAFQKGGAMELLISPLVGEMAGRPEGGEGSLP
ncbi:MAG: precorrin-3B synthase, partial [Mesorhizobium sp.]